jgi:UDP-N-acetylglucosamine--N-acetylmuramyl-(pentapeptide) pyrophosphoryl-undecaprenol N-acetylglucosamine transferase
MEKYFPAEKIVLTGNPVRASIIPGSVDSAVARSQFGLNPAKKTLLVLGGSLGARTLNESVLSGFDLLQKSNIQVIWQCGRNYLDGLKLKLQGANLSGVLLVDFISDMNSAYAAADVVISRAGALAISEISIAGKPVILVPSPVVAEDHQTKNAMTLVLEDAALMVEDKLAGRMLIQQAIDLIQDEARCEKLSQQIRKMARPLATQDIVNEIEKIIQSVSK